MSRSDDATGRASLEGRHANVRNLFLRLLGVLFLIAFGSLRSQVDVLYGADGLLPAQGFLEFARSSLSFWEAPSLFWLGAGDGALRLLAVTGMVLAALLILDVLPLPCLAGMWAIYLSYASFGQDFLSFQWDTLLLETALFSLLVAPVAWRATRGREPSRIAVFLMLWLLVRLHVESGAAKLLGGDETWRDGTAMASYYETAPIPTALGWYAHQLPLWAHRVTSFGTLAVELGLPLFFFGLRALRPFAFAIAVALQLGILLTANYGFFNYLSIALCLFLLDDAHLDRAVALLHLPRLRPRHEAGTGPIVRALRGGAAVLAVGLSLAAFAPVAGRQLPGVARAVAPIDRLLSPWRSINPYHLFARMTLVRDEIVIEGSQDGETWQEYELRYKPGDIDRAPPFVAPHQPRVDFQLWFLALDPDRGAPYFLRLLESLLSGSRTVAPLFARDPFPDRPPHSLRMKIYRYRFTDAATRAATGAWWTRTLEQTSRPLTLAQFRR